MGGVGCGLTGGSGGGRRGARGRGSAATFSDSALILSDFFLVLAGL